MIENDVNTICLNISDTSPVFGDQVNVFVNFEYGVDDMHFSMSQYVLMSHPLVVIFDANHCENFSDAVNTLNRTDLTYVKLEVLNEIDL